MIYQIKQFIHLPLMQAGQVNTSQEIAKLCPNSKVMELLNILYSEEGDTLKTDPKLINNWINTL